ncbi:hypothetical protein PYW07_017365 [Mythimna separata]|uniref:Uncharacterized protein n=1 Tax=Mythimna separata TaxID=271217 RepID=A0AAD7YXY6_MYTSE|nr:hypothetical protein PYW07_017365 [Mythimna separata]
MLQHQQFIDKLLFTDYKVEPVYVDDYRVPPTAIEGLRFLYKMFNLRKTGVILNDPDRHGRNNSACLFIRAIRPFLHRPILILCQEGREQGWLDRYDTWCSNMLNDLAVETENPYIKKKMVIINTMVNLHKFCEREWSVIMVDGDEVSTPNPILKLPFKTCFKVWVTEVNMKDNLDRFEEAYKWIFPREIFDKHFFIPKPGNTVDSIEKSILLDAFFEELVHQPDPSSSSDEDNEPECTTVSTYFSAGRNSSVVLGNTTIRLAPKVTPMVVGDTTITRATVDPGLGTSRMIGDTTITSTCVASTSTAFKTVREPRITPSTDYDMSVCDTSITATNLPPPTSTPTKAPPPTVMISRKNKDATGTKIKRSKPRIDSEHTPTKLFESPIAVLAKLLEESPSDPGEDGSNRIDYCIENFSKMNGNDNGLTQSNMESIKDEIKTDKIIEIIELTEKPDLASQDLGDKLVEMDTLVFGHDTLISQVIEDDAPGKGKNTATDKKEIEPHTILTCKPVAERTTHKRSFTDNKSSTSPIAYKNANPPENTEKRNGRKRIKGRSWVSSDESDEDVIEIDLDELNRDMRALVTRDKPDRVTKRQKTADNNYNNQTPTPEGIKDKFNGHNKETSYVGNKITEQIVNSLKRNNIDVQMKECEQTGSKKKLKGSLLDRLF